MTSRAGMGQGKRSEGGREDGTRGRKEGTKEEGKVAEWGRFMEQIAFRGAGSGGTRRKPRGSDTGTDKRSSVARGAWRGGGER